jgi:plastocyanin domain-containing protein
MRTLRIAATAALLLAAAAGCKGKIIGAPEIKEMVNITVDGGGFKPDVVYAKRGKPLTMVFNRTEKDTCATEVLIASERIRKELPLNTPTSVVFIPSKVGDINFACPMNMVRGTIKVVN